MQGFTSKIAQIYPKVFPKNLRLNNSTIKRFNESILDYYERFEKKVLRE